MLIKFSGLSSFNHKHVVSLSLRQLGSSEWYFTLTLTNEHLHCKFATEELAKKFVKKLSKRIKKALGKNPVTDKHCINLS